MQLGFPHRRTTWLLTALMIATAIFVESSRQTPNVGSALFENVVSVVAHLVLYCALSFCLANARGNRRTSALIGMALLAVGYGVSDELHQSFVAGRDADPFDVGLDAIGAAAGALLAYRYLLRRSRRDPGTSGEEDLHWATSDLAFWREPNSTEWGKIRGVGVDFVLDLRSEGTDEASNALAQGLRYRRMSMVEFAAPGLPILTEAAASVYERMAAGERVLVICREGRGRSPMVCCAALVLTGMPLVSAYRLVQRAQPILSLSSAQAQALEDFARDNPTSAPN
jgi:VanZ family protein